MAQPTQKGSNFLPRQKKKHREERPRSDKDKPPSISGGAYATSSKAAVSGSRPSPSSSGSETSDTGSAVPSHTGSSATKSVDSRNIGRSGEPIALRYLRTGLEQKDGKIVEKVVQGVPKRTDGRWHTLNLTRGQGGTFAYSTPTTIHTHAYPFERFRSNFVGTKGCVTCTGVFFEIAGTRFFCAHIDAWPVLHDSYGVINAGDAYQIRTAVKKRMDRHAKMNGWTPADVNRKTLILACPSMERSEWAIRDGIMDFLDMNEDLPVTKVHGFIIQPGARIDGGNLNMKLLDLKEFKDRKDDLWEEDVPREMIQHRFNLPDKTKVLQEFTYTCEMDPTEGRDGETGWHQRD